MWNGIIYSRLRKYPVSIFVLTYICSDIYCWKRYDNFNQTECYVLSIMTVTSITLKRLQTFKKSHKPTWIFQTKVHTMIDNIHLQCLCIYACIHRQVDIGMHTDIYTHTHSYVALAYVALFFLGAWFLTVLCLSVECQGTIDFLQPPRELSGQPTFGTLEKWFPFPNTKQQHVLPIQDMITWFIFIPLLHSSTDHNHSHWDSKHMLSL